MRLTIELPADIAQQLQAECGDLAQVAKEALAVEAYRAERLSLGQVAGLLGLSVIETEALLHRHGAVLNYTLADFDREYAALREKLGG